MSKKYLGLESAKALEGKRIRTKRELRNGFVIIPAGAEGVINGFVRNGHIDIIIDKCDCCGVHPRIGRLKYEDIELVALE